MDKLFNGVKNIFSNNKNKNKKKKNKKRNIDKPLLSFEDDTFSINHQRLIPINIKLPPVMGSVRHIMDRKVSNFYLPLSIVSLIILLFSGKNNQILQNINDGNESELIYIISFVLAILIIFK